MQKFAVRRRKFLFLHPQMPLKHPLFKPKFWPWLELGGGNGPLGPWLRTGLQIEVQKLFNHQLWRQKYYISQMFFNLMWKSLIIYWIVFSIWKKSSFSLAIFLVQFNVNILSKNAIIYKIRREIDTWYIFRY